MESYLQVNLNYDDENLNTDLLFGGLSVADRVTSINNKIDSILIIKEINCYVKFTS